MQTIIQLNHGVLSPSSGSTKRQQITRYSQTLNLAWQASSIGKPQQHTLGMCAEGSDRQQHRKHGVHPYCQGTVTDEPGEHTVSATLALHDSNRADEGMPCRQTQTLPGPAECSEEQDRL